MLMDFTTALLIHIKLTAHLYCSPPRKHRLHFQSEFFYYAARAQVVPPLVPGEPSHRSPTERAEADARNPSAPYDGDGIPLQLDSLSVALNIKFKHYIIRLDTFCFLFM